MSNSVGTAGGTYTERYLDFVPGVYQIPSSLRCGRLFLMEAADAKYVELVERYTFDPTLPYPRFGDRSLRDVLVRTDAIRR